ncbi:S10 family serine carboxypeptidase-like protein [uncultured Enorma sp.]|uniref:S10 family serine carboxypeptidase-like protein n=1 Tax=uncultured Enorma sp. TaxID=1714346 RepID=UPI0025EDDFA6|nr:peptidase S10 [uncultured Enorma sp.]
MEEQSVTQVASSSVSKEAAKPDTVITVPADPRIPAPESTSRDFVWEGAGERIEYTATAGYIDVRSDTGSLIGKMFSVAYVAKVEEDAEPSDASASDIRISQRPVTFCYNGGPGSSSVPINLGGIGPVRVKTDGTNHLSLPATLEDNPYTVLRQSDLVFLDALGTGYSAIAEGVDPKTVWGIDGDADAFCRAIIGWLDANHRWGSPVYLFGESYGTIRNAVLMRLLGEKCVPVRGVVMLSALFDWVQVLPGEDLYFLGMLPTFAAAARYFGRAGTKVDEAKWFDDAMEFTEAVYAPALLRGDRLPAREKTAVAKKMSRLIGLPADLIERYNLRIDLDTFRRSLLADEGRVIGRLDMRFASAAPLPLQASTEFFAGAGMGGGIPRASALDRLRGRAHLSHAELCGREPLVEVGSRGAGDWRELARAERDVRHRRGAQAQSHHAHRDLGRTLRRSDDVLERGARYLVPVLTSGA